MLDLCYCCEQLHQTNLSFSCEQGSEGEKKSNLMGTLFFSTVWIKNQHTNDADTHAKKHKAVVAQTQEDTNIPPTTHRQNTINLTELYANTFSFQSVFQRNAQNVCPPFQLI